MPDKPESLDRAYRSVRRKLLAGLLRTRKDLSRRRLAVELGISPAGVQHVLGRLEAERLLVSRPQSGTYLREVNLEEYHQHYDLREVIEMYAIGRAARWITPKQLDRMQKACDAVTALLDDLERRGESTASPACLKRFDQQEHVFHSTIMRAARNPMAAYFVENLHILNYTLYLCGRCPQRARLETLRETDSEHRAILGALRAGDAKVAESLMLRHLRAGRVQLSEISEETRPTANDSPAPADGPDG